MQIETKLRESIAVILFYILAVSFVIGTPIELASKDGMLVAAGMQSPFPIYAARIPYVILLLYSLLNVDKFINSLVIRARTTKLLSSLFLCLIASMVVALVFTIESQDDLVDISVDIVKYLAYILVMPLLIRDVATSPWLKLSPYFILTAAIVSLYSLLSQSLSSDVGLDGRLRFGLITTFAAKHIVGVFVLSLIDYFRLARSLLSTSAIVSTWFICLLSVFLTGTRGAWLFVGSLVAILILPVLLRRPKLFALLLMTFGFAGICVIVAPEVLQQADDGILARFQRRDLFTNRLTLWSGYTNHFRNNPQHFLLGIPREHSIRDVIGLPPHNWFLGITAQHGAIALMLLAVFNIACFGSAISLTRIHDPKLVWITLATFGGCFVWSMFENTIFLNAGLLAFILYSMIGIVWLAKCYQLHSKPWNRPT